MNYANAIKSIMEHNKISQSGLSKSTGIGQATLSRILTGKTIPSTETICKIAEAFGQPKLVMDFFALEDKDVPVTKKKLYKILHPQLNELFRTLLVYDQQP